MSRERISPTAIGLAALLVFPGALTIYLAFNSGGLFEQTTAFAALLVLVVAAVAVAVAPTPLAGLSRLGLLACGLLALFALWTLLSAQWSHADGRVLVSFDRVLLYLGVLALFACVPRSERRLRWLLRVLLVASAAVALGGLVSRLAPSLWPTATGLVDDRLSYPLTYWNTFGLLTGLACILAVHHTSDAREPALVRVGAAALLPLLGATLLLTFSRGALGVTLLGIVVYALIARPRGLLGGLLAAGLPTTIAVAQTYSAELVHEGTPLTPAAISQADELVLVLAGCAVGAAVLRALALALDDWAAQLPLASPNWRRGARVATAAVCAVAAIAFLAADGPSSLRGQYEKFVDNTHEDGGGQRSRLLEIGNDGRLPLWNVAGDAYQRDRWQGSGAGTFQLQWQRERSEGPERLYAYSLYFETLAELGLVGLLLLAAALATILAAIARSLRGSGGGRPAYAAAFALVLAWALHAGVDIDWQTPAVCVPVFALGGLALARPAGQPGRVSSRSVLPPSLLRASAGAARPALALACLVLAIVPARMALAQSHLRESVEALNERDCRSAEASAHAAIADFETGPRAYEVLAMCAARRDDVAGAIGWAATAVSHDPESWEPHYALALALGSAERDPRRQIEVAAVLNPNLPLLAEAGTALAGNQPRAWRRGARSLPFSLD